MDDDRLNAMRAERDELEARLLALEQAVEQHRRLRLAAVEGQAQQDGTDLAASVQDLLDRLAVVNTELAASAGRQE